MPVRQSKRRYIAFKILENHIISYNKLKYTVFKSKLDVSYTQDSNFRIINYDPSRRLCIVRCGHQFVEVCKKVLKKMEIDGKPLSVEIIMVSGTLKSLRKKLTLKKRS